MNGKVRALVGATGVSAVVAAVALSGGTSAFYYDSQHITGNSVTACTFGLGVESKTIQTDSQGEHATVDTNANHAITISNLEPGDKFQTTYTLSNTSAEGQCAGDLWADISGHSKDAYQNPSPNALENDLKVTLMGSVDDGAPTTIAANVQYNQLATILPAKIQSALAAGHKYTLTATYGVPLGARGDFNEIQGKSIGFNVDFGLVQVGQDPTNGHSTGL